MNRSFYGMDVKPRYTNSLTHSYSLLLTHSLLLRVLLSGEFERPKAAEPLYQALNEVLSERNSVTNNEGAYLLTYLLTYVLKLTRLHI